MTSVRSSAQDGGPRARDESTSENRAVILGLEDSRRIVRRRGPLLTVAGAAVIGTVGMLLMLAPGTLLGALGFVLIVVAAPLLGLVGAPINSSAGALLVGIAGSAALWFAVGWWAARRACTAAVVGWREFVRELIPVSIGVVVGAGGALLVAALSLGVL